MITVPILNTEGQKVASIDIDPSEFGGEVNRQLLHDVVVMYQANQRLGTHSSKRRGEVAGSGRKLYRQKGTGNARVGDRRTGKRRGGGATFGPKPRDYSYSMPKKARRLALRMALLSKFLDEEAVVVDGLDLSEPKTKRMVQVLKALGLDGQTCTIATEALDRNTLLSARNITGVDIATVRELNAYAVLRRKRLLLTRPALEALRQPTPANA